jgi:phosphoribosylaminoimidazole (AIR) synthetase
MGVGMVLVFDPRIVESAVSWLRKRTDVWVVGRVEKGSGIYVNGRMIGK